MPDPGPDASGRGTGEAFRPGPGCRAALRRPGVGPAAGRALQVELDALCQRQCVGVVDRVGLAAHVGAPGIRTRLAATAGFLLAAERATDLGARGADVDVGDAAVRAGGGQE